jgi:hypothetical protein
LQIYHACTLNLLADLFADRVFLLVTRKLLCHIQWRKAAGSEQFGQLGIPLPGYSRLEGFDPESHINLLKSNS